MLKLNQLPFTSTRLVVFFFVQRWIFIDGYADVLPGHSDAWFAIWKERQSQDTRIFPINTECKNFHQQESKNFTTFFPHAFRAKGDRMCHVYPVEDCDCDWLVIFYRTRKSPKAFFYNQNYN